MAGKNCLTLMPRSIVAGKVRPLEPVSSDVLCPLTLGDCTLSLRYDIRTFPGLGTARLLQCPVGAFV